MAYDGFCATLGALGFGLAILCFGYRLFLVLLPFWGFFFGLILGGQAMQAIFDYGFFANIATWIVAFLLGAAFAVLSYLFWYVAIALMAGSLGYAVGVGLVNLFGLDFGLVAFLVGLVLAAAAAYVTFRLNLQRYMVIAVTAVGGAASILMTLFYGAYGSSLARLMENPVRNILDQSWLWVLLFLALLAGGLAVQVMTTRDVEFVPYENRI
jgi:hypothetical protein